MGSGSSMSPQLFGQSPSFMLDRNQMIYDPSGSQSARNSLYASPYTSYLGSTGFALGEPTSTLEQASSASQPSASFLDPSTTFYYPSPTSDQIYLSYTTQQPAKQNQPDAGYYSSFYAGNQNAATDANSAETQPQPSTTYADFSGRPALVEQPPRRDQMQMIPERFGQAPRRSGTVALRMDEATRLRLIEHLRNQQRQVNVAERAPVKSSNQQAVAFMPLRADGPQLTYSSKQAQQWQSLEPEAGKQSSQTDKREQGQASPAYIVIRPTKNDQASGGWRSVAPSRAPNTAELDNWRSMAITPQQSNYQPASEQERDKNDSASSSNGQQVQRSPPLRLSRTPNQSSVKSRHPNEALTDYGLTGAANGDTLKPASADSLDRQQQQQAQTHRQVSFRRQTALADTLAGELGSLSNDNNKNNVIKVSADGKANNETDAEQLGPEIVVLDGANVAAGGRQQETIQQVASNSTGGELAALADQVKPPAALPANHEQDEPEDG